MVDLSMASLLPILVSSVTATCFTYIFIGSDSLFNFHLDGAWIIDRVPASIILGIVCGIVSLYFIRSMSMCENFFARLKSHTYAKLITGGLIPEFAHLPFPRTLRRRLQGHQHPAERPKRSRLEPVTQQFALLRTRTTLILYVALVIVTKTFATSATNGGGGCGGTFAPSLFVGAFSRFLFSRLWNMHQFGVYIPERTSRSWEWQE